ncbi:MAG: hypothetical protein IKH99_01745 [Prevotella sp.]|nr:hypothetical protein [Prevotella sp.]
MRKVWGVLLLTLLLMTACHEQQKKRGMYYWSTVFRMDSAKQTFLKEHQINRLYVRYFDVVVDEQDRVMPNATISFKDSIPLGMEVIPTVFIVNDCMKHDISDLAEKLLRRIIQMNETHHIGKVHEIQIDCDWTPSTRKTFFHFMETLRTLAKGHDIRLSSTIRLHQLSQQAPPADYGVLMMYNTGDFTKLSCERPILDMRDVRPYLPALKKYSLPLSAAYPLYRWRIVFRNGRYVGILHTDDELPILPGDSIVIRQPELEEILKAKQAVTQQNARANNEVILFDLNNTNISRFKKEDYEKIFND